jgi:hypothetical protein
MMHFVIYTVLCEMMNCCVLYILFYFASDITLHIILVTLIKLIYSYILICCAISKLCKHKLSLYIYTFIYVYIKCPISENVPLKNVFLWDPTVTFQNTAHVTAGNLNSKPFPICSLYTHTLVQPWRMLLHTSGNGPGLSCELTEEKFRLCHWLL